MDLQRQDAFHPGGVAKLRREQTVDTNLYQITLAVDLEIVPVIGFDNSLRFVLPAIDDDAASSLLVVDRAPPVALGHIRLQSVDDPVRKRLASKLNPTIVIAELDLELQVEVAKLVFVNQERVRLESNALSGAHQFSVLDSPKARIAVPPVQSLAIKQWTKSVVLREPDGGQQYEKKRCLLHHERLYRTQEPAFTKEISSPED